MVLIDVEIANRFLNGQVHQAVFCQECEHVIEESDPRVDLRLTGPVQDEIQFHIGFRGTPRNGAGSVHGHAELF